ncbi:MAG: hypothetical protein WBZ33_13650 [Thermoactinomyces sp.]
MTALEAKRSAEKWIYAGFLLQIGIILYWEITQYVDLFPFNDVVGLSMQENIAASCANDIPKASIILILLVCLRWMTRPWYQCLYAFFSYLLHRLLGDTTLYLVAAVYFWRQPGAIEGLQ